MLEDLLGDIAAYVKDGFVTEIRLRIGKGIVIKGASDRSTLPYTVKRADIENIIARATKNSLYAYQDYISKGFLPYAGGVRIGLAGKGVAENGKLVTIRDISSLNIRVPHEIRGCAAPLRHITDDFQSTLIVSPPFAGKTTLIRDMARALALKYDITVIDERDEICGGIGGAGDFGDVISGVDKSLATEGAIRSLAPEIIVMDELFPEKDGALVESVVRAGVKILASVHADSFERITALAPSFVGHFSYGVLLGYKPSVGSIKSIVRFGHG